jgi:hypothetical protein
MLDPRGRLLGFCLEESLFAFAAAYGLRQGSDFSLQ